MPWVFLGWYRAVTVLTELLRTATSTLALSMVAAAGASYRPAVVPRKNQTDTGRGREARTGHGAKGEPIPTVAGTGSLGEAPRQAATHFTGMPGLPEPGNAMTPLDRRLSGSSLHPEGCSLAVCVPVGPAGLNLPGSGTSTLDAGPCCHTRRAWPSVLQTMPVSGIRLPPRVPSGKCARVSRSLAVS